MTSLIYNVLLIVQKVAGTDGPPPPDQQRPPGFPIDDNIWVLLASGILLGVYIIYRRNSITNKAS